MKLPGALCAATSGPLPPQPRGVLGPLASGLGAEISGPYRTTRSYPPEENDHG